MTDEATVKEHEENVAAAKKALAEAKAKAAFMEFPKWVAVHESHIHKAGDHISVPLFPDHHVDREGKVTVLVHDLEHEAKALAAAAVKGEK
jgi:hypothetical protein